MSPMETSVLRSADKVASILSFLDWWEIMDSRRVCRGFRDAGRVTAVDEEAELVVRIWRLGEKMMSFLEMASGALPMTRAVTLAGAEASEHYMSDPLVRVSVRNLEPVMAFHDLRTLNLRHAAVVGDCSQLFRFQQLLCLRLISVRMTMSIDDLVAGLPRLETFVCIAGNFWFTGTELRGNIGDFAKAATLKTLALGRVQVGGSLEDLAQLPLLEDLLLTELPNVTGDIRNIRQGHFPSLKTMRLISVDRIYGASMISFMEASTVVSAWHGLLRNVPTLSSIQKHYELPPPPPYMYHADGVTAAPFHIELILAGRRFGYRWRNGTKTGVCDIIWLDPAPDSTDGFYHEYRRVMGVVEEEQRVSFFRGITRPPDTYEDYDRFVKSREDALTREG